MFITIIDRFQAKFLLCSDLFVCLFVFCECYKHNRKLILINIKSLFYQRCKLESCVANLKTANFIKWLKIVTRLGLEYRWLGTWFGQFEPIWLGKFVIVLSREKYTHKIDLPKFAFTSTVFMSVVHRHATHIIQSNSLFTKTVRYIKIWSQEWLHLISWTDLKSTALD